MAGARATGGLACRLPPTGVDGSLGFVSTVTVGLAGAAALAGFRAGLGGPAGGCCAEALGC